MLVERSRSFALWRALLVAGFGLIAALNFPGHLPLDSVTGLWEGRHHLRMSWGPPVYSAILGVFDRLVPGWTLYVLASLALTALAWAALPVIRGRVARSGPLALVAAFALPQVLIFQGIVWRDVLFANLAVASFVALALAARLWTRPGLRWPLVAAAALALAVGALVRQNGGVLALPWAAALGWIAARGRPGRGIGWAAAGLAAVLALALALGQLADIRKQPGRRYATGPRLIAQYDLTAALAENPAYPLPRLERARPEAMPLIRREARLAYSPTRTDTIDAWPAYRRALWRSPEAAIQGAWLDMVRSDPLGYARRRLEVFRWVFLTPRLELCVPLHLGVQGLPQLEKPLGLRYGPFPQDAVLYAYARRWFATPFYSHLTYALIAAAAAVFLMIRRTTADVAMAALMAGALGFAATFFFISLACDYRYLYVLDLAAVTGLLYIAIDPSLRRGKAWSRAARTSA